MGAGQEDKYISKVKVNVVSFFQLLIPTTSEKKTLILWVDGLVDMKRKKETLEHCSCSVHVENQKSASAATTISINPSYLQD
jgi:hypothetical protein